MAIIVQKYGGSSVANVAKMGKVAERVVATRNAGHDVVVVISAMGKTTDQLLALAREVDESPPRRELDMLLSTGERISMALMSMAIQKRGCDAISFTGSQSGLITNDRHFDARIIDVRPHRVEDELARGRVVIIAGYQGMSYKREITTLGRGGSDTTALAMAAALGAERAEIYSDVDGVYSADPREVKGAHHLKEIGYEEMQNLAESGAKVLHARAVEFAREAKIAIHARSTFDESASPKRTLIHEIGASSGPRAVTSQRDLAIVEGDATLLERATSAGVSPRRIELQDSRVRFEVAQGSATGWTELHNGLVEGGAVVTSNMARVTVVGSGLLTDAVLSRAHTTLAPFSPARVDFTPMLLSAVVDESSRASCVAALHAALLE